MNASLNYPIKAWPRGATHRLGSLISESECFGRLEGGKLVSTDSGLPIDLNRYLVIEVHEDQALITTTSIEADGRLRRVTLMEAYIELMSQLHYAGPYEVWINERNRRFRDYARTKVFAPADAMLLLQRFNIPLTEHADTFDGYMSQTDNCVGDWLQLRAIN
ncbi:MAG: hypothetical protein ACREPQ_14580 [Rhodanobacter sp.]